MKIINSKEEIKEILFNATRKGLTRKLDNLGRIVIPKEYRNGGGFYPKQVVVIDFIDDCVIIKKQENSEIDYARKIDGLGRVVIPKEFRDTWDWQENDILNISTYKSYLLVKKVNATCVFCHKENDIETYINKYICNECKQKLLKKMLMCEVKTNEK